MWSLKPGRGPSFQGAIGSLVVGLFGVLWTVLAVAFTAQAPIPLVGVVFPAFGVIFTILAWSQAVYHFINATSEQRFSEYDFVSHQAEPDPLQQKFSSPHTPAPESPATNYCTVCGTALQPTFHFCPKCGKSVR